MEGTPMDNLALARKAWSHYLTPPRDLQPYFDALADDVVWTREGPPVAADDPHVASYPLVVVGKQAVMDMATSNAPGAHDEIGLDFDRPYLGTPMEFVADGDRVVMLLEERYRIAKTDATVRHDHVAVIMDFRDGLIAAIRIIGSLSDSIEAHLGVGWSTRVPPVERSS
jgi:ketosteroid isomerase-like protein